MALNLFKILTIFGNFAKGCESFFKMAQKGLFCTTVWYNQNSIRLKKKRKKKEWSPGGLQQNNCDHNQTDAEFQDPKVKLLQLSNFV